MRSIPTFLALFLLSLSSLVAQQDDTLICKSVFSFAFEHKLIARPIGEIVAEIGAQFIGKPYEAHTLDKKAAESVVTNLHSFDCVTFVENVFALARTIKNNRLSFDAYRDELVRLRYRSGIADDYASRLHYFSEWIHVNEAKGYVQDVTKYIGGAEQAKTINFMTQHRKSYPQLAADSLFVKMKSVEERLSTIHLFVIPRDQIKNAEKAIHSGDIIAIATSVPGLDVSHTGIAVRSENGELRLMHAPDTGGKIHISEEPLWKYVAKNSKNTGIIVAHPVDVSN